MESAVMRSFVMISAFVASVLLAAGPAAAARVEVAVAARAVENREPVGVAETFPADVGKVYCYTKVVGAAAGETITHVWYHGDRKMAEVTLSIGGPSWRTYSSKRILPSWTGRWRVEIVDSSGNVIETVRFAVE